MKKIISIVLCAVMLLSCMSFAAFADNKTFTQSNEIATNETVDVNAGEIYTVPAGLTVYVPTGAKILVHEGGTLTVYGKIIVLDGGSLMVDGTLVNGQNVTVEDGATAEVKVSYKRLAEYGAAGKVDSIECLYAKSPKADISGDFDQVVDEEGKPVFGPNDEAVYDSDVVYLDRAGSFYAPLNEVMFVKVVLNEPVPSRPRFDPSNFVVYYNGVGLAYKQGYFTCVVSNAGELSYTHWTQDSDFYKLCRIDLPSGEGYEVIGRDDEVSADGTVYLKYGEPFAFRVDIDEAYDMSPYEVYVFNGYGFLNLNTEGNTGDFYLSPVDGWYTINEVIGDTTVSVVGVTKNSTINLIGNIMDTIRSIFNMLKEFFEGIVEAFKGGF